MAPNRRFKIPVENHWSSPEVALFLTLLGLSLALVPMGGLAWYWAIPSVCGTTIVGIVFVTRLAAALRTVTVGAARLPLLPLALAIVVAVLAWQLVSAGAAPEVPAPGAVVDARTGEVLPPQAVVRPQAVDPGSQIEGGDVFRACNLSAEPMCPYRSRAPVYARRGDRVRFKLRLHEPAGSAIGFLKLSASPSSTRYGVTMSMSLEWPTASSAERSFASLLAETKLRVLEPGTHYVSYVPGSTVLGDVGGAELARLPDGIMDGFVMLRNVGAPKDCWNCDLDYVRFVSFSVRLR